VIACANVMNLTLARATARQREIAVRVAIGAARWRIVRHLVAETLLVSMVAGAAGLLLSMWILRALYTIGQELWPFPWAIALSLTPDVRVFTYTFGIAASAGLAFGLVPAWQMSAPGVTAALHDEGRMLGLRLSRSGIRRALVVLQLAACVVLLVAAGLLARGLRSARAFEFGFAPQHVVYAEYNLRRAGYSSVQAAVFTSELRARMERTPGVATVAFTSHIPLHGGVRRSNVRLADDDGSRKEPLSSLYSVVSPEYFDVMSIPVVAGRNFVGDAPADVSAVVISEGIARKFWPGSSAVGKTIVIEPVKGPLTVVGVVRDAAGAALWRDKEMSLYLPLRQSADMRDMRVLVRTSGDTAAAAGALRRHAAAIDGGVALDAAPLETLLKFWMLPSRGAAIGATALGLVALAMASIGIYGVLAFTVTHRTREIGVRMALGADAADVRRLILRDGLVLIAMGLAAGIICARLAAPVLSGLLFDVKASDPLTFTIVPALLAAVALAACYVPARRASKLEPLTALRVE
jgi:predicted permease